MMRRPVPELARRLLRTTNQRDLEWATAAARAPSTVASPTLKRLRAAADAPGGITAGSYTATVVSADAGSVSLSRTFLTCRLGDYVGPALPKP